MNPLELEQESMLLICSTWVKSKMLSTRNFPTLLLRHLNYNSTTKFRLGRHPWRNCRKSKNDGLSLLIRTSNQSRKASTVVVIYLLRRMWLIKFTAAFMPKIESAVSWISETGYSLKSTQSIQNRYFRPISKIFESLGSFFKPNLLFQITGSKDYPGKQTVLRAIWKSFESFFILPPDRFALFKYQTRHGKMVNVYPNKVLLTMLRSHLNLFWHLNFSIVCTLITLSSLVGCITTLG